MQKEVAKILLESKNNLNKEIQSKKQQIEKEIENEIIKAQKEIIEMKKKFNYFNRDYFKKYCIKDYRKYIR